MLAAAQEVNYGKHLNQYLAEEAAMSMALKQLIMKVGQNKACLCQSDRSSTVEGGKIQGGKRLTCLSGRAFCHIQGFSELGKAVIDGGLLQSSPISCQPLVQGDGVPLRVLPVGDAGWDLPVLLVLNADGARGGVHDGNWGRACTSGHLQRARPA